MFVFFHIGAVSGDLVGSMDSGYSGLCVFDRLLLSLIHIFVLVNILVQRKFTTDRYVVYKWSG